MNYWQWTRRGFYSELSLFMYAKLFSELNNEPFVCDFTKAKLGGERLDFYLKLSVNEKKIPLLWYRCIFSNNRKFDDVVDYISSKVYARNKVFTPHNLLFQSIWNENFESQLQVSYDYDFHKVATYFHDNWRLSDNVKKRVKEIQESLSLNCKYLALHIRRGDKLISESEEMPISSYFEKVNLELYDKIFVATDDFSVISEIRSYLLSVSHDMEIVTNTLESKAGHLQSDFNNIENKLLKNEIIDLLAETELLRLSDVFVGSFSSNIGRYVHLLRFGKNSYSVDIPYHVFVD